MLRGAMEGQAEPLGGMGTVREAAPPVEKEDPAARGGGGWRPGRGFLDYLAPA